MYIIVHHHTITPDVVRLYPERNENKSQLPKGDGKPLIKHKFNYNICQCFGDMTND